MLKKVTVEEFDWLLRINIYNNNNIFNKNNNNSDMYCR